MMSWLADTAVPLRLALALAWLLAVQVASSQEQVLLPWTIEDCPIPRLPDQHPVSQYKHHWLNLHEQLALSSVFWFMFSGETHNIETCGLRQGVLYRVTRHNKTAMAYHQGEDDPARHGTRCRDDRYLVLAEGSNGFISCAESREKATLQAGLWWDALPISYIATVLIGVGVAMLAVTVVGVVVGVVWRRRSRGNAALT